MGSLFDLDVKAKEYAEAVDTLRIRKKKLDDEITTIHNRLDPGMRTALLNVQRTRETLEGLISCSADCFQKPKTLILQGVKIGFTKGKGKIQWVKEQTASVVKMIKKLFPETSDMLLKTEEKPIKEALSNLPASDLRRMGITVTEAGDKVVVKMADSNIDKFITAFLKANSGVGTDEDDDED